MKVNSTEDRQKLLLLNTFGDWEASIDRQVYKGSTSRKVAEGYLERVIYSTYSW